MFTQKIVDLLREQKGRENSRGNLVHRYSLSSSRYHVDCDLGDWLQFDTDQDAEYFGFWVNPEALMTLTYCEGDWVLVVCPTKEGYNAEIADACRVYDEGFIAKAIDEQGGVTVYCQDRQQFFLPEA